MITSAVAQAQRTPVSDTLWLTTGAVVMSAGEYDFERGGLVWIQFYELPDDDISRLFPFGFRLIQYVGNNTYLGSVPTSGFDATALRVRSVVQSSIYSRIAPELHPIVETHSEQLIDVAILLDSAARDQNNSSYLSALLFEYPASFSSDSLWLTASLPCWSLRQVALSYEVLYIESAPSKPTPENQRANIQHRANLITTSNGITYTGSGVKVAIGDEGPIGTHIDFMGRLEQLVYSNTEALPHSTIVGGILGGAGNLNPAHQGVAPGVSLKIVKSFDPVKEAFNLYNTDSIRITCASFSDGCNRGYTTLSHQVDDQIANWGGLMHVFSAGNAGEQDCDYGAGVGWGNITGGVKTAKNCITVGNVFPDDNIVSSSSRGPTADGRIKPDLVANGNGQTSTIPNNAYAETAGSSAAAPVIAGVIAQMYEANRVEFGAQVSSDLVKAALLNTAEDLGQAGPDYVYGWGRVHAGNAWQTIKNNHYFLGVSALGELDNEVVYNIEVPQNTHKLKVMLYWHDAPASPVAIHSLVNDLELRVSNSSGAIYQPYMLSVAENPTLLDSPAQPGEDHLNNVEQVVVAEPEAGVYTLHVTPFDLPSLFQRFVVVYEFVQDEIVIASPVADESVSIEEPYTVTWDAPSDNTESFQLSYSVDFGNTWVSMVQTPSTKRQYNWLVPSELAFTKVLLRIQAGDLSTISAAPFTVASPPKSLTFNSVCPESIKISWKPVPSAVSYTVYKLGNMYMDSVLVTQDTFANVPISDPNKEYWFAVRANGTNGMKSQRSIAISAGGGLFNCNPDKDVSVVQLSQPQSTVLHQCFDPSHNIAVVVRNTGTLFSEPLEVFYQVNNAPPVSQVLNTVFPPNVAVNVNFDIPFTPEVAGNYQFTVWVKMPNDEARYNDTIRLTLHVAEATELELPYIERFDSFDLQVGACGTSISLQNGWINEANIQDTDDWGITSKDHQTSLEVNSFCDQNSTGTAGKYLLLNNSNSCTDKEATLYSPCINLGDATQPQLNVWVRTFGIGNGQLHVDLFDGENWYPNISIPTQLNTKFDWQKVTVDLSIFANETIILRFRANTDNDPNTKVAIDNLSIIDVASAPIASFTFDHLTSCSGVSVRFKDNSYNSPTQWQWSFEPNTVAFVSGTHSGFQNPEVNFLNSGQYSITLIATNENGQDTFTSEQNVLISNGYPLPYRQDFEAIDLINIPTDWSLSNNDQSITWQLTQTISANIGTTHALYMDNHSYNAVDQNDLLVSPKLNLTDAINPLLRFDVAYATFSSQFNDQLTILVSDDCGNEFNYTLYQKDGAMLATAGEQMQAWSPKNWSEWRTEYIDLTPFVGNIIQIQFINTCGFGNNLYLDNILVCESTMLPKLNITVAPRLHVCADEQVTFTAQNCASFPYTAYLWEFGQLAIPTIANTIGPHMVTYPNTGVYPVRLLAEHPTLGYNAWSSTIEVLETPVAEFTYTQQGNEYSFNVPTGNFQTYHWEFGDGYTSTEPNPTHTYTSAGDFDAFLTVSNDCGESYGYQLIHTTTSINDPVNTNSKLQVFPNPADQAILIRTTFDLSNFADIFDMQGRKIYNLPIVQNQKQLQIDTRLLPSGAWVVRFQTVDGTYISCPFVVQR